ncbi:MAG TPA: hypothetical protein VK029_09030 [Pseudogracilibacillus sp.]|nr:hypothetical protein [Pseudogracilibacillus sp.]
MPYRCNRGRGNVVNGNSARNELQTKTLLRERAENVEEAAVLL